MESAIITASIAGYFNVDLDSCDAVAAGVSVLHVIIRCPELMNYLLILILR